jgi:hypothetical protein
MYELLQNPLFLSLATGVLIVLGTNISWSWVRVRKAALEADLKREMIDRGMSADDIVRVIGVRSGSACERVREHA